MNTGQEPVKNQDPQYNNPQKTESCQQRHKSAWQQILVEPWNENIALTDTLIEAFKRDPETEDPDKLYPDFWPTETLCCFKLLDFTVICYAEINK